MIPATRISATILLAVAWTTGLVVAQGGQPAPAPAPQGQTAPPAGRGAGPANPLRGRTSRGNCHAPLQTTKRGAERPGSAAGPAV